MFETSLDFVPYNVEYLRSKGLIVTENTDLGISVVRYHKNDNMWKTKTHGICDLNDRDVYKHRSVIYSLTTGFPISVSPISKIPDSNIGNTYLKKNVDNLVVTPYIDGTMINVFWNPNINVETGTPFGWTLSTRSKIHATCKFTSDRLFKDLFEEARINCGMEYDNLDPLYNYTFVLVHPETRRITSYDEPKIILVSMVRCIPNLDLSGNTKSICHILPFDEVQANADKIGTGIRLPELDIKAYNVLEKSMSLTEKDELNGWVISAREGSFNRIRILTDGFCECMYLRGDSASYSTNYIRLLLMDKSDDIIRKYLKWYPDEKDSIDNVKDVLKVIQTELYNLYVNRHIKRTMEHTNLPHWSRRPIFDLHGYYLRNRTPLTLSNVFEYFCYMSPSAVNRIIKNREKEIRNYQAKADAAAAPAALAAAAPLPASEASTGPETKDIEC